MREGTTPTAAAGAGIQAEGGYHLPRCSSRSRNSNGGWAPPPDAAADSGGLYYPPETLRDIINGIHHGHQLDHQVPVQGSADKSNEDLGCAFNCVFCCFCLSGNNSSPSLAPKHNSETRFSCKCWHPIPMEADPRFSSFCVFPIWALPQTG